jgi:hypothetical protein
MTLVLGLTVFICLAAGAAILLFRRLVAGPKTLPVSVDWISELSASRYRPMERLLSEDDYRYVAGQPGCDRQQLRALRSERRRMFRGYLACLKRDFGQISAALRLMLTYSSVDRPDLATLLYKQQALFAYGMVAVEWRLFLHACGIGSVDVRDLLKAVESMHLELRQMIPVGAASLA